MTTTSTAIALSAKLTEALAAWVRQLDDVGLHHTDGLELLGWSEDDAVDAGLSDLVIAGLCQGICANVEVHVSPAVDCHSTVSVTGWLDIAGAHGVEIDEDGAAVDIAAWFPGSDAVTV